MVHAPGLEPIFRGAEHSLLQNRPMLHGGVKAILLLSRTLCERRLRLASPLRFTLCFEFESREVVCTSAMHRLVRLHLETNCKKLGTNKICLGPSISGLVLLPREALARPLRRVQRT